MIPDNRTWQTAEHAAFRDLVRRFFARELVPHLDRWEVDGIVDRGFWRRAGEVGLLCPTVPEAYGGPGLDFGYNAVLAEELAYAGSTAPLGIQSDITAGYFIHYGTEEQKRRWLPAMVSGEVVTAIAMTEPGTGSDLQGIRTTARRDGDHFIVSGAKTYITNGQHADLIIVAVQTGDASGRRGLSLILVEGDRPGFVRGRNLDKIGQNSSDTSELFFEDVRVPAVNLLGPENGGFACLVGQLAQERLGIAIGATAMAERALDEAISFSATRQAFGQPLIDFQHSRFQLATMAAKQQVGWAHADWALNRHLAGELTADEAAAAKLWHCETMWETVDMALQLHGGAGYMNEYPIARLWRDARVLRILGGTSEIMREMLGRTIARRVLALGERP